MQEDKARRLRRTATLWERATDADGRAIRAADGALLAEKWGLVEYDWVTFRPSDIVRCGDRSTALVKDRLLRFGFRLDLGSIDWSADSVTLPLLLDSAEVMDRMGWSSSNLYRKMANEGFPRPFCKSGTKSIWSRVEIAEWEDHLPHPGDNDLERLLRWASRKGEQEALKGGALDGDNLPREWLRNRDLILIGELKRIAEERPSPKREFARMLNRLIAMREKKRPRPPAGTPRPVVTDVEATNDRAERLFLRRAMKVMETIRD